jgi:tripartite-type tricarboxylate transporter receptor subunit TctC
MLNSKAVTIGCAVLIAAVPATAFAQQQAAKDYPSRPIRMVVPFVPGGIDAVGLALGRKISPVIGQNMFIDNRAGAGGVIGTDVVAKAAPDGYTMLLTSSGHASLPSVMKSLPYDPVKDFAPITLAARSVGFVLVVHPSVPARSVKELIALAKAQPGKLNYGSTGVGAVVHLATEAFNTMAGTQIAHVPYKGTAGAIMDLMTGRIDMFIMVGTLALEHIRSGRLRALGITGQTRWNQLPEVPTIDEAGLKGYAYVVWYGLWFPAGTPAEYVTRMRNEVVKALDDAETKRAFAEQGFVSVGSTPQEFSKTIIDDIEFHRRLVRQIGLAPQ